MDATHVSVCVYAFFFQIAVGSQILTEEEERKISLPFHRLTRTRDLTLKQSPAVTAECTERCHSTCSIFILPRNWSPTDFGAAHNHQRFQCNYDIIAIELQSCLSLCCASTVNTP